MHPQEAARVLAAAAAYDKRTPSNAEAYTWGQDLGDITVEEAVRAVREHFKTRPDTYLQVGHVIEIVKRYRRTGLDQSSRLENAAIVALDPDDPDYDRKYMAAIHNARHTAATDSSVIPEHVALPSRSETDDERRSRARRGAQACREVLAGHHGPAPVETKPMTRSEAIVAAARERAAADRRAHRYPADPTAIRSAASATLRQIRTNQTGGGHADPS